MVGDGAPRTTVQVKRSVRRRRTVAAYRDGDTVIVLIPARFTASEEREWVEKMLTRLDSRERRGRRRGDTELEARARQLARAYFADSVRPVSVRWVTNQHGRWGSCTPADGSVRLSDRLRTMPSWVIDYVLIHELAHLRVPGHGPDFWELVDRYPRAQRARGFLEGVASAAGIAFSADRELGGLTGGGPDDPLDPDDRRTIRGGSRPAGTTDDDLRTHPLEDAENDGIDGLEELDEEELGATGRAG